MKMSYLIVFCFSGLLLGEAAGWDELPISEKIRGENHEEGELHGSPLRSKPRYELPIKIDRVELSKLKFVRADNPQAIASAVGKDTLVGGKVHSFDVPKSGDLVILNLGPNPKNCFKVVVFQPDFDGFGKKEALGFGAMFKGKNVLAGGIIAIHKGMPQIVACAPSQLLQVE